MTKFFPKLNTLPTSLLYYSGVVFTLAVIGVWAPLAKAAETTPIQSLTVTDSNSINTTIPDTTIASWQGGYKLATVSAATSSITDPVTTYVGIKPHNQQLFRTATYDPSQIYAWLKQTIEPLVPSKSADAKLVLVDGRATEFEPGATGSVIDLPANVLKILAALEHEQSQINLTITPTKPAVSLASTNNLGITELIARGESSFKGSPKNRRFNIKVGVEKEKGTIIKQGEEFSFNKYLGPVDGQHGFLPELVIKKTGTVPEFGGGLCQVSSTTFRAAMQAGLPITQRRNHSYAVQYYAPQGTDATIYPGVIDLKFINDTPGAILVWPYFKDDNTLVFDFYGTKDNRTVVLDKPVQYDRQSNGAMKAYWKRTVTKDGVSKSETFNSTYQPPALFHKEEAFVSQTGTETTPGTTPPTIPTPVPDTVPVPTPTIPVVN